MERNIIEIVKRIDQNRQAFLIDQFLDEVKKLPDTEFNAITEAIEKEYNQQNIKHIK